MFRHGNWPTVQEGFLRRSLLLLQMSASNASTAASAVILSTLAREEEAREAPSYCTKPTLGTGVGSGTSRMGPNCFS
jgi:hypothetical protein